MTHAVSSERLWNVGDVAAYLDMPTSSVYKMTCRTARVKIPHVRIAGRLRFRQRDIDRWLELLTVSDLDIREKAARAIRRRNGIHPS